MTELQALLMGLLQGLTEYLPVSSSGHLTITSALFGISGEENLTFTIAVHVATVLSTLVILWREIVWLLRGLVDTKAPLMSPERRYILAIIISMIPIGIVGVFFKDEVESLFGSITVVGFALIATAVLLFFSDFASRPGAKSIFPENTYRNGISYWQAFAVGLGQAFAVVPGLSRSGTTISTGLICGVKREVMAQFSFLMVLVPILGETFLEVVGGDFASSSVGATALVLGFISAFVSGLFACKVMIALVKKAKLSWFALYCLIAAVCIFIFA
jgi:undecaprenyl-diphosphatase